MDCNRRRLRHGLLLLLLSGLIGLGCATTSTGGDGPLQYEDPSGLYALTLPSVFEQVEPPNEAIDAFFINRAADIVVGVVIDTPPVPLLDLDKAVTQNATVGYGPERLHLLHRGRTTELGGLPASETEFVVDSEEGDTQILTFNVHTSTEEQNLQLVVGGPVQQRNVIAHQLSKLVQDDFRFLRQVKPFPGRATYALDGPDVPIRFSSPPEGWTRLKPKKLHDDAALDMHHRAEGLFMMLIIEDLDEETREVARVDDGYYPRLQGLVHDDTAGRLTAVPPGNTDPFDMTGQRPDTRWSVSGTMNGDPPVALTYRIRLRLEADRVLRFYCWGPASDKVIDTCNELYDDMALVPLVDDDRQTL